MEALTPNIFDFSSLSQLKYQGNEHSPENLRTVAQQFEALFLQMLLKSMRDANKSFDSELFNDSTQEMYHELYDQQLALSLAAKGGMGLTDVLVRQLSKNSGKTDTGLPLSMSNIKKSSMPSSRGLEEPVAIQSAQDLDCRVVPSAPRNDEYVESKSFFETFGSPKEFVLHLWDHASEAAKSLGLDPKLLIAQAALETGWGQKLMIDQEGNNSYNLFGVKAHKGWEGKQLAQTTHEFKGPKAYKQVQDFRVYNNFPESFQDYANFIQHTRYTEAREKAADPEQYIMALQKAGYATDPQYAKKVMSIYHGSLLNTILGDRIDG